MSLQINRRRWLKTSAFSAAGISFLPHELQVRDQQIQTNLIRLRSNENPHGFSLKAKQALVDKLAEGNRYANPAAVTKLAKQIAIRENLKPEKIVSGAGSGEVLCMAAAFGQKKIIAPNPIFSSLLRLMLSLFMMEIRMRINFNFVNRFTILVALCLFVFQSASAQNAAAPSARQIEAKVDEYMKAAVEVERFSGSILIARDGRAIVSKSYGMANVELDVPNTPNTVFRLASITKQFTATAIMMLQERGKLNVNDPICKYLTDCPAAWQPIMIRQLLTMTGGIPNLTGPDLGLIPSLPVSWEQWLAAMKKKPLDFVPGEEFKYANGNYTLLGFIIERVSGKSYGEFLQENIFTPLGMKQTGYEDPLRIIKNRATGYRQLPGDPITNVPYAEMIRLYAAGGLYSTTGDLLLWDKALYTDKLLSRKSIDEMFTPFREMLPGKGYAYGWWTSKKFGRQEIAHGGNLAGFITYIARFPAERVTVIVLSNNGRGSSGKISNVLSAVVFGAPYEIPKERKAIVVASSVLDKYVGQYRIQLPQVSFTITNENGKLTALRNAEPKVELFAESETDFFLKTEDIQFKFVKDANGVVTNLIVHQGDGTLYEVMTGQKIK